MMFCDYQYVEEAPVSIEPREVLRFQGCRAGSVQVKKGIQRLVQSQIDHSYRLIQPQAVFRIFPSCLCSGGDKTRRRRGVFSRKSGVELDGA